METQASVHSGKQEKSQPVKAKYNRRTAQATNSAKEQQFAQRRVFGTTRNTNIPDKVVPEKPKWQKPSLKPTQTTPPPIPIRKPLPNKASVKPNQQVQTTTPVPEEPTKTNKLMNNKKKKSVSFLEKGEGTTTPGVVKMKARISGTPYHTAEKCSKCRFDKMETASYWLAQVRLAESVGKHFVSAGLFKLAMESKAEPIRNLQVELNRYVLRHRYLSVEPEWKDVTTSYGLNITSNDQVEVKAHDENGGDLDQRRDEFTEQLESTFED